MKTEVILTLPPHIQVKISSLYQNFRDGRMSAEKFYEQAESILGRNLFDKIFDTKSLGQSKDIKSDKLDDVFEYSGVDLKKEQENIVRDVDSAMRGDAYRHSADQNNKLEVLFDKIVFDEFLGKFKRNKMVNIDPECTNILFQATFRRVKDLIDQMNMVSKVRVDFSKEKMNVMLKVENDVKKQLYLLEEELKNEELRTFNKKESAEEIEKKKNYKEREDLLVKKRASNNLALQALGSQKTDDWLDFDDMDFSEKTSKFTKPSTVFNEKEVERRITLRKITIEDVIFVFECDKEISRSLLLMEQYFK